MSMSQDTLFFYIFLVFKVIFRSVQFSFIMFRSVQITSAIFHPKQLDCHSFPRYDLGGRVVITVLHRQNRPIWNRFGPEPE